LFIPFSIGRSPRHHVISDKEQNCCSSRLQSGERWIKKGNIIDAVPERILQVGELPDLLEGGIKAYLAVAGAFARMFVSFGWVNCIAIFQAEYESTN
jgi:hypothetical protein